MSPHHMSDTIPSALYALSNLMQTTQWSVVVITLSTEEMSPTEVTKLKPWDQDLPEVTQQFSAGFKT